MSDTDEAGHLRELLAIAIQRAEKAEKALKAAAEDGAAHRAMSIQLSDLLASSMTRVTLLERMLANPTEAKAPPFTG